MIPAGSPIKKFIEQSLSEIKDGLPTDFQLSDKIDFELSVVDSSKKEGGTDIRVLKLGGDIQKEFVQRIKFSVINKEIAKKQMKDMKKVFSAMKEGLGED